MFFIHLFIFFSFITSYKPREAIEVYRRAMLFRDAVMLAKTRFAPDDPIVSDLYMAWGQHQEKSGHFVPSAMRYSIHPSLHLSPFNSCVAAIWQRDIIMRQYRC